MQRCDIFVMYHLRSDYESQNITCHSHLYPVTERTLCARPCSQQSAEDDECVMDSHNPAKQSVQSLYATAIPSTSSVCHTSVLAHRAVSISLNYFNCELIPKFHCSCITLCRNTVSSHHGTRYVQVDYKTL